MDEWRGKLWRQLAELQAQEELQGRPAGFLAAPVEGGYLPSGKPSQSRITEVSNHLQKKLEELLEANPLKKKRTGK